MTGKWEIANLKNRTLRHTGGGYGLVLECYTKGADEWGDMRLGQLLEALNRKFCACGRVCDESGYCDDCLGG